MLRSISWAKVARQIQQLMVVKAYALSSSYSTELQSTSQIQSYSNLKESSKDFYGGNAVPKFPSKDAGVLPRRPIGENLSRREKTSFLVSTLLDIEESKEAIYGALDAWVAWERDFPIGPLKHVIVTLEKEQQWRRVIQVIKWMLSKGQGTTMGTYGQLIQALDMDRRQKEAHEIWTKKIGYDLHSVPWKLCKLMISIYHRNNMLEDLVKLFKGLEGFDRKPPEKSIVRKVADAYEMLGLPEEKERVMEKYKDLFTETWNDRPRKHTPKKEKARRKG